MKNFIKNKKGFTLMEMVVSMSIIVIVSTMVIANFRVGERSNKLIVSAQKLISDIRQAQNYALSLKSHNGSIPPGGWGVFFRAVDPDNIRYRFFADTDAVPDHYCSNSFPQCQTTDPDFVRNIDLPEGIVIDRLRADGANSNQIHISFEPPLPKVFICKDAACDINELEIDLSNGSQTITIFMNKFGLVEVK